MAEISTAVACRSCGDDVLYVGKLPAVGLHAAVDVFKCRTCLAVHSRPAGTAEPEVPGHLDEREAHR